MAANLNQDELGKKLRQVCGSSSANLQEVEQLIAEGASIDFSPDDIGTPLFLAAGQGHEQIVEFLLKNKANINFKTELHGWSPLHSAIQANHENVVRLLLDYGADPHIRKENGATPFISAAINGNVSLLQVFLNRGADVNEADANGFTAFMEAAEHNNEDALRFLFEHNADVNKRREVPDAKRKVGRGGKTALMSAVENDCENIINILFDEMHPDVNIVDNLGRTALFFALKKCNKRIVKLLLDHEANVNFRDNNQETPLSTAMKTTSPDSEIVEMLIKHKAKLNVADQDGRTPLMLAIKSGLTKVAELLLDDYSVEINAQDNSGSTALLEAVNNKNFELTKRLCERGVDVSCEDNAGNTPIMVAKRKYAKEIIKLLNQRNFETKAKASSNWKKWSERWHPKLEKLKKIECTSIGNLKMFRRQDFEITTESRTKVYLGFYDNETEVAVKCHRRSSEEASKEKQCLREPKIKASSLFVKLLYCETDEYCEYLCLDLCEYNLDECVQQQREELQLGAPNVMKQLIEALQILHGAKFAHRDLHPTNVLRDVENRIHLADFGKSMYFGNNTAVKLSSPGTWEASEILQKLKQMSTSTFEASELYTADLQALGRLLHYIVTGGEDPYKNEEELCENKPLLNKELYKHKNAEVRDFIEGLLAPAETRITLQEAEQHPFLWKESEKIKFVQDLANEEVVTKRIKNSKLVQILNEAGKDSERSFHTWTEKIDQDVLKDMNQGQSKKPTNKKIYQDTTNDLLKFIRNLTQHFNEKDESIKNIVGKPDKYCLGLFPDFIISIYNALKDTEWKHHFPNDQRQLQPPLAPRLGSSAQDG
ncbi:2-5A-dependent ribonuclease-like [Narcine bancroftii]|uniref:2-5A-dependent ribonuclease-like n=1 Tax=Narcine bancroftii TaxID=1343680 RepID=UPI0038318A42